MSLKEVDEAIQDAVPDKSWGEVVRAIFPNADDNLVEFLLWERTAFPHAGRDYITDQLTTLKTTQDAGLRPCDLCNKPATVTGKVFDLCAECDSD